MKLYERILYFQGMLIITAILDLLWAFPIKWAWNYVMPYLFGLPTITWLHSFLLLIILNSLWRIQIVAVHKDTED